MKKTILTSLIALTAVFSANALSMYVLDASSATIDGSNPQSTFYKVTPPASESGTAASIFSYAFGTIASGAGDKHYVDITWGANPQPFMTGAAIKQANGNASFGGVSALIWDLADFSIFNASSGVYDTIRLIQDGIFKKNKSDDLLPGISHATLDGRPGTTIVPDSGTTIALLGAALLALVSFRARKN